jgi:[ribosomal protein S5]-alanine N-acetyltransferase
MEEGRVILETPRLLLREFVAGDAEALGLILSDAETMRFYRVLFDRAGVAEWIARNRRRYAADGHGLWGMVLKASGELIGDCGVTTQSVDGVEELEIGYHLRRECWGFGYATEAARACRDWAFLSRNVGYLISLIRPENLASRRVAERNGMRLWKSVVWRELEYCVYRVERAAEMHHGDAAR